MKKYFLLTLLLSLLSTPAFAQQSSFKIDPKGVSGSVGAGVVLFKIDQPAQNFSIDQGIFAALSGEKGFGLMHLYLSFSLSYLTTKGQTNYNYSTLSGNNYTGTDVHYKVDLFQGGLGLKFKLLDNYWLRPYVEGGGLAGYFKMDYTDLGSKVVGSGTDYRSSDALLDFGSYYEGGMEISFAPNFGLRVAARFSQNETKPFETLAKQKIKYKSEVYYLSVLANF